MSVTIDFQFGSAPVRTLVDNKQEIWFVANDIAEALGYVDPKQAIRDNCRQTSTAAEVGVSARHPGTTHDVVQPHTKLINEGDMYRLVMRSKLKSAEAFQDWVCGEVLPQIRRTGKYSPTPAQLQLEQFNKTVQAVGRLSTTKDRHEQFKVIRQLQEQGVRPTMIDPQLVKAAETLTFAQLAKNLNYFQKAALTRKLYYLDLIDEKGELTAQGREYGRYTGGVLYWMPEVIDYIRFHS